MSITVDTILSILNKTLDILLYIKKHEEQC